MPQTLFVRTLRAPESRKLQRIIRQDTDARIVRRAQIIRLSARGYTPSEIAELLERSCSGVRKIINRFNAEGFDSLADKPRVGRPRKRTDRYVALLKEAVQANPRDLGYPFSCWDAGTIAGTPGPQNQDRPEPASLVPIDGGEPTLSIGDPSMGWGTCEIRRNTTRRRPFWSS